jgi:hypothetical protein
MALSELTNRDAVLAAIKEYDALGQDEFLAKYGYSRARRYWLVYNGKSYDAKAIVGVAFWISIPRTGTASTLGVQWWGSDGSPFVAKTKFRGSNKSRRRSVCDQRC